MTGHLKTFTVMGATSDTGRALRRLLEEARVGMLAAGMSESFADAVLETARSFNDNQPWGREKRTARNTTATTLEHWARQHLT